MDQETQTAFKLGTGKQGVNIALYEKVTQNLKLLQFA
jgi:hypothetical protein